MFRRNISRNNNIVYLNLEKSFINLSDEINSDIFILFLFIDYEN